MTNTYKPEPPIIIAEMEPLTLTADTIHIHSFSRSGGKNPRQVWASITLGEIFTINDWEFEWSHYENSKVKDGLEQNNALCDARFLMVPGCYRNEKNPPKLFSGIMVEAIFHAIMEENEPFCEFVKGDAKAFLTEAFRPNEWQGQTLNLPVNRINLNTFECHNRNIYTVHIRIGEEIIFWSLPVRIGEPCRIADDGKRIQSPILRSLIEDCLNSPQVISHAKGTVAQSAEDNFRSSDWSSVTFSTCVPGVPIPNFEEHILPPPVYFT